jgi:aminoglycoside phosphotransferase (APT) family kinase protein
MISNNQVEPASIHEQLLPLLKQVIGSTVELVGYEVGNRHHDYLVLLAQLQYPSLKVVVKLAGPEAPLACPFDRTATLHRLVAERTTIPMPEVLAADVSYQHYPWRYFIKTHVPGHEWAVVCHRMNPAELSDAYRQLGEAVAQLHAIHFPTFGELSPAGEPPHEAPFLDALQRRADAFIHSARLRDLLFFVLERDAHLFANVQQASLVHEDLHQHNILFEQRGGQWHLATILDFDKAWVGHHESDLARLDLWRGMTSDAFRQGYQTIQSIDPLYPQRRPIYQLFWCLEYAQNSLEHLADTQRLCLELGIPAIEHFD